MTLNDAIRILMQAAERDVRGSGMGYRNTTDEWRAKVATAWVVAFRRVNGREPRDADFYNSGMLAQ